METNKLDMSVLLSTDKIRDRVNQLGKTITSDYKNRDLVVVGVLKGSVVFLADLVRSIDLPLSIEFIGVSSYHGTESTGHVRITQDLSAEIRGRDVLIVEDIVDTGLTIEYLINTLKVREPRSIKICSFLSKPEAHLMRINLDYVGFEIANEFVVGYGLDLDGKFRNLPHLAQIKQ